MSSIPKMTGSPALGPAPLSVYPQAQPLAKPPFPGGSRGSAVHRRRRGNAVPDMNCPMFMTDCLMPRCRLTAKAECERTGVENVPLVLAAPGLIQSA
jgi:hypothetical protein